MGLFEFTFCCSSLAVETNIETPGFSDSEWGNEGILLLSDDTPHNTLTDTEHFLATTSCSIV